MSSLSLSLRLLLVALVLAVAAGLWTARNAESYAHNLINPAAPTISAPADRTAHRPD